MEPRRFITFANVVACLALFVALGGASYAAFKLPKNSVGTRELKPRAVKTGKVAKSAIVTNRLRNDAVTGAKVKEATLGTVPSAEIANGIVQPEDWHEVGSPGEPAFQNGWLNVKAKTPPEPQTTAFYIDREGVVHLKGLVGSGTEGTPVFQLPAGYRPASNTFVSPGTGLVGIYGSDTGDAGLDGAVVATDKLTSLDGIAFRAES